MKAAGYPWLRTTPTGDRLNLFCLPYGGGDAYFYQRWVEHLPECTVHPVHVPGRAHRIDEPPITEMGELVEQLFAVLAPHLDTPYAILGSSMGAWVGYALTQRIADAGRPGPRALIVCAAPAPDQALRDPQFAELSQSELISAMSHANPGLRDIAERPELAELVIPVLRADLQLGESWTPRLEQRLGVPVVGIYGEDDVEVEPRGKARWGEVTEVGMRHFTVPGDHLFMREPCPDVFAIIRAALLGTALPVPRSVGLFPGLGAQYTGMGRDWYERYPQFRQTFEQASEICGLDLMRLCRDGSERAALRQQRNGQLALFTYGVAAYRVVSEHLCPEPAHLAGHSLGELTALCVAGAFSFADGLRLVDARAGIIQEVAKGCAGTMVWVVNLDAPTVDNVCASLREQGLCVHVSSYDAPTQVAISGLTEHIEQAAAVLESLGAIVFPLRLPGPYHSPLMAEASARFAEVLVDVEICTPDRAVLSNTDGRPHAGPDDVRHRLAMQLSSPLHWTDTIQRLVADGVGVALEIGPKAVVTFLLEKNTRRIVPRVLDRFETAAAFARSHGIPRLTPAELVRRCWRAVLVTPDRIEARTPDAVADAGQLRALAQQPPDVLGHEHARRAIELTNSLLRAKGHDGAHVLAAELEG